MRRIAGLLALVLAACAPEPAGSPALAWREFSRAYARADVDGVWRLLSTASQAELTKSAQAVALAQQKPAPPDGRRLVFEQGAPWPRAVTKIDVVESHDDRALLEVTDDAGGKRVVMVVREGKAWRVDLSDALRNAVKRG